jgi:alpha-L-rhamnosidase
VAVTVDARGFANATLRLHGGELTDGKGAVINQLRSNTQVFWRLAGLEKEVVAPTFVFFGAQFFGVDGWPAGMPPPTISSAVALPTSTLRPDKVALSLTFGGGGGGSANTTLLAGVQAIIQWTQRANFQSIPSDCPNREKRGWMGDGQVSAWQASVNFDVAAAYRSWTLGMLDDQARVAAANPPALAGDVSPMVPAGDWPLQTNDAAWGAAIGEVPYQMLRQYGDVTWLARVYPGARAYFRYLVSRTDNATGVMSSEASWGDWDAAFPRAVYQPNTMHIGATSAHVRLAQQLREFAPLVGRPGDAAEYDAFLGAVRAPFNALYANATAPWTYADGVEQTPTLLPLALGLVPPALVSHSVAWLINDVETTRGVHLSTGATGTRLFFAYLSSIGRTDLAAAVAAQDTFPSHGFWVAQGATTCWENWSGATDAQHGNVPPTHNHIFLGSHSGWMWESLVGVAQPEGSFGYARVAVRPPLLPGLLEGMAGELLTARGAIGAAWATAAGGATALNVSLPANVAGTVSVPVAGLAAVTVTEGGAPVWRGGAFVPGVAGVYGAALDGAYVTFEVGSGEFAFAAAPAAGGGGGFAPSGCSGRVLACAAPGARIAAVKRAGLASGGGGGGGGAPWARRFLAAHVVESACVGRAECVVPSVADFAAAVAPAVALRGEEAAMQVCVEALCA